jgi:uncharacterized protein with FMN-binding domain
MRPKIGSIGKPINRELQDGVYQGSFAGGPNKALVQIMIKNNKIIDIQIMEHRAWKGKKAENHIRERIIKNQRTNVDVVSGATNSSIVIMNAVQKAVEKAYKDKN